MAQLDFSTIIAGAILAASNLGAAKLLLTRSLDRQDKMDQKLQDQGTLIATATQTQATTVAALAKVQESVKELYESRNKHETELVEVHTLHDLKGCKVLNQSGKQ